MDVLHEFFTRSRPPEGFVQLYAFFQHSLSHTERNVAVTYPAHQWNTGQGELYIHNSIDQQAAGGSVKRHLPECSLLLVYIPPWFALSVGLVIAIYRSSYNLGAMPSESSHLQTA